MIKSDLGTVSFEGNRCIIRAELSTLIYAIKSNNVLTDEEIKSCVDMAVNTNPDELLNDFSDKLKKILDILGE